MHVLKWKVLREEQSTQCGGQAAVEGKACGTYFLHTTSYVLVKDAVDRSCRLTPGLLTMSMDCGSRDPWETPLGGAGHGRHPGNLDFEQTLVKFTRDPGSKSPAPGPQGPGVPTPVIRKLLHRPDR
jgi:hypothetical protein